MHKLLNSTAETTQQCQTHSHYHTKKKPNLLQSKPNTLKTSNTKTLNPNKNHYLPQSSSELPSSEVRSSSSCQRNSVTELIQSHIFLYILGELNSATKPQQKLRKKITKTMNKLPVKYIIYLNSYEISIETYRRARRWRQRACGSRGS